MVRTIGATIAAIAVMTAVPAVSGAQKQVKTPESLALAPHAAVYEMTLLSSREGSGVIDVKGQMRYQQERTCDGWIVLNHTDLLISNTDSAPVQSVWRFDAFESLDGSRYRFHARSMINGVETDLVSGLADAAAGSVTFTHPEESTAELPPDILFPMIHTVRLIENAKNGRKLFSAPLFDGTGEDSLYDVNAVIRPSVDIEAELPDQDLLDLPAWRVSLAFFNEKDPILPELEMSMDYHANGVASNMSQDYGEFALRAKLVKLQRLPDPAC